MTRHLAGGRAGNLLHQFSAEEMISAVAWGAEEAPAGLADLLLRAFNASLYNDERRPVCFTLVLRRGSGHVPAMAVLARPTIVSPETLRKFALATDRERSGFLVSIDQRRRAWIEALTARILATSDPREPSNSIEIEVSGAGRIGLRAGRATVRFDRGRMIRDAGTVRRPRLPKGAAEALAKFPMSPAMRSGGPDASVQALFFPDSEYLQPVIVDRVRWGRHKRRIPGLMRRPAAAILGTALDGLTSAIRSHGHGGAVMVLPFDVNDKELRQHLVGGFWFKHKSNWSTGLLQYVLWSAHYALANRNVNVLAYNAPNMGESYPEWGERTFEPRLRKADALAESDVERIARLTQIDGALVLSALLSPRAFGVTLKPRRGSRSAAPRLSSACEGFLSGRGHRHRSLAEAVANIDGSVGIVVSEDGSATRFFHVAQSVRHDSVEA